MRRHVARQRAELIDAHGFAWDPGTRRPRLAPTRLNGVAHRQPPMTISCWDPDDDRVSGDTRGAVTSSFRPHPPHSSVGVAVAKELRRSPTRTSSTRLAR
nr:unnamed protein product [Digitaria exilis]